RQDRAAASPDGSKGGGSKGDRGAQPDHRIIGDPAVRRMRVHDPAAWVEDVLKIGLQLPPAGELETIRQFEQRLARADRVKRAAEARDINVERPCRAADPGVADADPDLI